MEKQKIFFAQNCVPDDPDGFLLAIDETSKNLNIEDCSLTQIKHLYEKAPTSLQKFSVLILAVQNFSKSAITSSIGCSMRQVDKARLIEDQFGICAQPSKKSSKRKRMNPILIQHFLQYLHESGSLQTAAYGTNKYTFEDGNKALVPKPVLCGIRTHICAAYIDFCNENQLSHLSFSSLMKIINEIKPAPQSQLSGLDNFLVDGIEAIETLILIVKKLEPNNFKEIEKNLRKSEIYIKTNFSLRCSENANCTSHCITCALSDSKNPCFNKLCSSEHDFRCPECDAIIDNISTVENMIHSYNGPEKDIIEFDMEISKQKILNWLSHQIRGVQQNKAQSDAFENISESTALWLRDWSQKVLPQRFREKQQEYFGKRGMIFVTKIISIKFLFLFLNVDLDFIH